jgi:hypothetical protein
MGSLLLKSRDSGLQGTLACGAKLTRTTPGGFAATDRATY